MMEDFLNKPHQENNNLNMETEINITLTTRESAILEYICEGETNTEIAKKLSIGLKTVEGYKTKLLAKTNTRNSAHLVMYAAMHGLIEV